MTSGTHLEELTHRYHGVLLVLGADKGSSQFVTLGIHQFVVSVLAHLDK